VREKAEGARDRSDGLYQEAITATQVSNFKETYNKLII